MVWIILFTLSNGVFEEEFISSLSKYVCEDFLWDVDCIGFLSEGEYLI